jgi:hypothetical protein
VFVPHQARAVAQLADPVGCSVPPVVAKDYEIKGEYIQAAGMKTCIALGLLS